jgi:hypothetical protein
MFLDDLIPDIEAHIPDVTDEIYMAGLRFGARKFFKDSKVWCKPLTFNNTSANTTEFDIDTPCGTILLEVPLVLVDAWPIKSVGFAEIRASQQRTGIPSVWYREDTKLHIGARPCRDFDLEILGVLIPTPDSIEIDADNYIQKYSDAIVHLARYHILGMSKKVWTDLPVSRIAFGAYSDELLIARREALGYLDNRHNMMKYTDSNGRPSDY